MEEMKDEQRVRHELGIAEHSLTGDFGLPAAPVI
jgi:hypothetical protein